MIVAFANTPDAPRPDAGYQSWSAAAKNAVMRHDVNDRTAGPMPTFGTMVHETALAAQDLQSPYAPSSVSSMSSTKPDIVIEGNNDDGYSFADVIDIINPLQHLPVIGTLYRKFTGDTIKPMANIIGGAIFGGPVGAVSSTVNAIVKDRTGRDLAENAMAFIGFDSGPAPTVKPDIDYAESVMIDNAASLVAANLYQKTASGQKNFAAQDRPVYSWNA